MQYHYTLLRLTKLLKHTDCSKILIAISGGQDSIFLINIINYIIKKNCINVQKEYIYIDHQWKNDSKIQTMHLINYIYSKKQKLFIYQIKNQISKEHIARSLRYNILIQHSHNRGCRIIMTAHNLNDTLETFLINIIRGTSLDGCTSLKIQRYVTTNIKLIRPILNIHSTYIKFHCL